MKIDRLVSIIMILLDKEKIGAKELADMFEVSPRTIYRDIDAINMAGIPICSTAGVGGGFEILQSYKIDKNVFSSADLSTILMGLSSISNMVRGNELINALTKVKSFIPAEKVKDIELRANQIRIDWSTWISNSNIQQNMEIIQASLQESRLISFEYVAHHGQKSMRTVEPYQLVLKNSNWYFQGYCYKRNDFRLFRLSRILKIHMEKDTFIPRNFEKSTLDFEEIFDVIPIRIKLRIHESIMDRLLDYCSYEHFSPVDDEYYIVDFPFVENDYNYDLLLSFGLKCECLEPLHIRKEMQRKTQALASKYQIL